VSGLGGGAGQLQDLQLFTASDPGLNPHEVPSQKYLQVKEAQSSLEGLQGNDAEVTGTSGSIGDAGAAGQ
jgi:hypothetical protein